MKVLAVTACPTGIAHTYMAAEALSEAAQKRGYEVKVETRGSVGVENELSSEDIKSADFIVLACDTAVPTDRFVGKKVLSVSVSEAIKDADGLLTRVQSASVLKTQTQSSEPTEKKGQNSFYKHLMSGVSFMIPFVVAGGIAIAISFAFGYDAFQTPGTLPAYLMAIGGSGGFGLMVPILAGYIAYSIADRPGLAPGMIGGVVAGQIGAGFLGGMVAGFLAGYVVNAIKKYIKLPKSLQGIMPVLIIPVFGSLIVGLLLFYVLGSPMAAINKAVADFLMGLSGGSAIILGLLLGLMMAFDMGGPINKAAYAFGTATLVAGQGSAVMAAVMAGGMVPPLGIGLATLVFKKKFVAAEQEAGKANLVLGASFITEGAIPFAAADPLHVMPSIMVGGALAGALSMAFGATLAVPHGGIFVLFAVENIIGYVIAIVAGSVVTALLLGVLKKDVA